MMKYSLNLVDKDINTSEESSEFENGEVYKVFGLEFGGFLAFESDALHVYKRRMKQKLVTK